MRWYCWHNWSKWKTYRWQGTIRPYGCDEVHAASRMQQARVCLKCAKEVHRIVENASGCEYEKVTALPEPQGRPPDDRSADR
jgi:hypothetical protein